MYKKCTTMRQRDERKFDEYSWWKTSSSILHQINDGFDSRICFVNFTPYFLWQYQRDAML
ncbi:uncharacterized protein KLLA0_F20603g [Kluyveromyces lactis]|uniref:KLLA0F20603p n=1 Tax=Kluyveromyces lactis (strain ATCC 8585 / CBS 2359 / DSM 70799 / NBRC 1267 / NRRL Y-1140 / WM37) TaxID=284590 RepID=B5FV89_KLULA|nr:uncharacterized protein KLLA0_F20603g [Kluyveromyces lactis]CAR64403.1 KLLA0F20603p [Kluyveromyces lactis]|eukprot:XP_002999437.1 uncharacterized protein KLLA0_F20603g [Kluyveromyces lactis]